VGVWSSRGVYWGAREEERKYLRERSCAKVGVSCGEVYIDKRIS